MSKSNEKRMKNNELRVMRIKEAAIREFVYEMLTEHGENIFNIPDITKVSIQTYFDMQERDLICVVHNRKSFPMNEFVDFDAISDLVGETTCTVFTSKPYVELDIEDIKKHAQNDPEQFTEE